MSGSVPARVGATPHPSDRSALTSPYRWVVAREKILSRSILDWGRHFDATIPKNYCMVLKRAGAAAVASGGDRVDFGKHGGRPRSNRKAHREADQGPGATIGT